MKIIILMIFYVLMLGMVFAIPVIVLMLAFAILPIGIILSRKTHLVIPPILIAITVILIALFNFDHIGVIMLIVIMVTTIGCHFWIKARNYIIGLGGAIALVTGIIMGGVMVMTIRQDGGLYQVSHDYIVSSHNNIFIIEAAKFRGQQYNELLDKLEDTDCPRVVIDKVKAAKNPNAETKLALEILGQDVGMEMDELGISFMLQYCIALAISGFLIGHMAALPRRITKIKFEYMHIPRGITISIIIAVALGQILTLNTLYAELVSQVFFGLIIIPYALTALSLAFFMADYIENNVFKKACKVLATALLVSGMIIFSMPLVFAVFGMADSLLDSRYLLARHVLKKK